MVRATTLEEVARRVGVSARTVSRVVNDEGGFSEATRARVEAAIAESGYRPNLRARSLVTNRTGTVALVITFITDPYFPDLADSVGRALGENGQTMLLASNHDVVAEQARVVDSLISHGVDGIIVFPARTTLDPLYEAADLGIPVVVIDHLADHPRVASVRNDITGGARMAVEYLVGAGHRSIGMITNEGGMGSSRSWREDTFRAVMAEHGYDAEAVAHAAPTYAGGVSAAERLLAERPEVTAIFAYNDLMALGAIQAAARRGRTIPDDLAIVGFDDIDMAGMVEPALTTIRLDREELGARAATVLNRMIEDPGFQPEPEIVATELVVRRSA